MNDNRRRDNLAHAAAREIWPNESVLAEDLEALKIMAWQQLRQRTKIRQIPQIIADEYRAIIQKSKAKAERS